MHVLAGFHFISGLIVPAGGALLQSRPGRYKAQPNKMHCKMDSSEQWNGGGEKGRRGGRSGAEMKDME